MTTKVNEPSPSGVSKSDSNTLRSKMAATPTMCPDSAMRARVEALIRSKQQQIVKAIEEIDGCEFIIDRWQRSDGTGEGTTTALEEGNVIERGGANISIVHGILPEAAVRKMSANHSALRESSANLVPYWVCGLSLIMHPKNPMAPTVHLNYRYFETQNEDGTPQAWWFGGGSDLTPYYLFEEDAREFHTELKRVCDKYDPKYYPEFKEWCDKYFYNTHRNEGRGIGGIFFDDLVDEDPNKCFNFISDCLDAFLKTYIPILKRRKDMPFTDKQKEWQLVRRGRYVEFNLIHDRGTQFGMMAPGTRIESILISLPLMVSWRYKYEAEEGSEEDKLVQVLRNPREWA